MTKRLFVCYALERDKINELRDRLERISRGAQAAGYETYVHARDAQQWNITGSDLRQVLDAVFRTIRGSDAVLMDLTIETPGYKRVGLNIECGFAKALDKPIAALWREPDRPAMTTDLADEELAYRQLSDIESATAALLTRLRRRRSTIAAAGPGSFYPTEPTTLMMSSRSQ